jgi:hypothetical protein
MIGDFFSRRAAAIANSRAVSNPTAQSPIAALWAARAELYAVQERAMDAEVALPRFSGDDNHVVRAASNAHEALWVHDEKIMDMPVTCPGDLAIKALINRARFMDTEGYHDEFVTRLIEDMLAYAATR